MDIHWDIERQCADTKSSGVDTSNSGEDVAGSGWMVWTLCKTLGTVV